MEKRDYDLVVVGAGGAGLAAAAAAAAAGASVLVAEAAGHVGGSTALAGGSFMAAGTRVQQEAGYLGDSVDEFVDYYLALSQWHVDPAVVRRFCERATPTLDWLVSLGVRFTPDGLYRAQLERFPRSHRPVGAGKALVETLHRTCQRAGVDIALGHRVDELITQNGRVCGIAAAGEPVSAGAVILTTGGFGNNPALVAEHFPSVARSGDWVWSPAPSTCQGEGLQLGLRAGAGAVGHDRGEALLTPGLGKDLEPFLPGWLTLVNREGRRFVNEAAPYPALAARALAEGGSCWVIVDEQTRLAAAPNPDSAMFGAGTWRPEVIEGHADAGRISRCWSIDELAVTIGAPVAMLEGTVRRVNRDFARGADTAFGKPAADLRPIATPPFYCVELRVAVIAVTGYGLRIDADARALRCVDDDPVPGLYAAGEVTGSLLGPLYLGGGNAVGNAIVFGRIAAQTACRELAS